MGSLLALAAGQGGIVLLDQLADHEVSPSAADRRVRRGEWQRIADGVYRVFPAENDLDRLRSACVALPMAIVSHGSAAFLHGLTDRPPPRPVVTVHPRTTHVFPEVDVRRTAKLDATQLTVHDGLPITTEARTLLDLAADLAPVIWDDVADRAIGSGRVSVSEVRELADHLCGRGRPGSTAIRRFLEDPDIGASRLERRAIRLLRDAGLPPPKREFPIPWSPHQRFDLAYPGHRLAIELDGRRWHDRPGAFQADRERDRAAARHGWVILRFTWLDLHRAPHQFIRTVSELLVERSPG